MSFTSTISPLALVALSCVTMSFISPPACAADLFAGKSIDLLIGAPAAGGYDIYARALARHFGRSIPGNPSIIPKNMPGAASGRAAGFLSTIAPKDGTVIAAIMPGAVMGPLLDEKAEVLFDPTKVQYLGTANNGTRVCVSYKDSKIKTFDDTMKDPQYLADADKMRIDISPLPGPQVQEIVRKLHATPKDIVEKARAAIRP
jgi:tripartite-type tricarboxylate transporter receptor subunit TctC